MTGFLRPQLARAAPVANGRSEPTPARRALPAAIAASLSAHGLLAGVLASQLIASPHLSASRATSSSSSSPPSSSSVTVRSRGVLSVSLTRGVPVTAAAAAPLLPTRRPPALRKTAAVATASITPGAKPTPLPVPVAPPPTPAEATAPLPTTAAQFAGLFAPIIRSPLGRGGWGRSSQAPRPAAPLDAQQQREQAALAFQMNVQGRLAALAEASRSSERAMSCQIVIDTEQRVGEVVCAQPADQAAPWSYLQGVLMAGTVTDAAPRLCYALAERQLLTQACPDAVPTP